MLGLAHFRFMDGMRNHAQECWHCPLCNSTNHFPDYCPFCAGTPPAQLGEFPPNNGPTRNSQPLATAPALQSNLHQPLIPTPSTTEICRDFKNIGSCPWSTSCRYCHICEHCYGPHSRHFCPNLLGQSSNLNLTGSLYPNMTTHSWMWIMQSLRQRTSVKVCIWL